MYTILCHATSHQSLLTNPNVTTSHGTKLAITLLSLNHHGTNSLKVMLVTFSKYIKKILKYYQCPFFSSCKLLKKKVKTSDLDSLLWLWTSLNSKMDEDPALQYLWWVCPL